MLMVKLQLSEGGYPACLSKECPFNRECAQHITAGDFRSEGGLTPELFFDDFGGCFCNQTVKCKEHGDGMLVIKNGKLKYVYNDRNRPF